MRQRHGVGDMFASARASLDPMIAELVLGKCNEESVSSRKMMRFYIPAALAAGVHRPGVILPLSTMNLRLGFLNSPST